ncbi:MAG: ATP-binding cassette domain-containing protein [Clostridiales bacterium]|nr:ATP-binding cassette domain-containing protein [Clostridiales bacterium]
MSKVLIETKKLKKYFKTPYGKLHAVDGIDLIIKEGTTLGIVGESGCGKSTLARTIIRLYKPTDGQIIFDGKDISKLSEPQLKETRKDMQMIFQDPYSSINPRMSVSQLIAEPIIINNIVQGKNNINQKVSQLMETVGLASRLKNAYPHELDGGRRQRIGVARALAVNPKFIICDEPVSALDVSIQAQILNLLMDLQKQFNLTYMFITHDMSVVKHISDEIMVMHLGECVEMAKTEKIFIKPIHPYSQALLSSIPVADLKMKDKPEIVLMGEITSPIEPMPGCRFRSRCQIGFACPGLDDNKLFEVESNHFVSCRNRVFNHYNISKKRQKTIVIRSAIINGAVSNIVIEGGKVRLIVNQETEFSKDLSMFEYEGRSVKYGELDELGRVLEHTVKSEICLNEEANLLVYQQNLLEGVFIKGQWFNSEQIQYKSAIEEQKKEFKTSQYY